MPFGLLYTLGYSLPRLARDDETRALAREGAVRTETSAAALGTVLGGYAATGLGNVWVYAIVAIACLPIVLIGLNLLPRGIHPFEELVQSDHADGLVRNFVRKPAAIAIALFVVLPVTVAAGYASFLYPIYSDNLGLLKSDINNIYVLGQLIVYVCIDSILGAERHRGAHRLVTMSVILLGVFCLVCAGLFYLMTRGTVLTENETERSAEDLA